MASIFTFDPDPPRVSSPWSTPPPGNQPRRSIHQDSRSAPPPSSTNGSQRAISDASIAVVDYSDITRLEAEPQEGPTEYKLHLLLRRRRSFMRTSTGRHISGSLRRAETPIPTSSGLGVSDSSLSNTPPPLSSTQSRQHRLEQLTTQLLWRLQQSCPYHISSSTALVLPHLPDESQLSSPVMPQRLLPGLEESKGALYEIGVADDGTFVGLAEDEMEESLNNLRAMAASLGCHVEVQRMVCVGECEWFEDPGTTQQKVRTGRLLVAEALVLPNQRLIDRDDSKINQQDSSDRSRSPAVHQNPPEVATSDAQKATQQIRVSLTGATMSGKSSLLGSLSTATLDNGRGKSRLSLLKHRHEIASGMTSSVTQELIGYRDVVDHEGRRTCAQVISYGAGDVSSWVDIFASTEAAEDGRLVFLSDSAGHPRFRRTTVRGLVGWDPHWTLLCIPADNAEDSSGKIGASPTSQEILGPAAADLDLSQAHLQLCLNLELPLVVVITKYDLATRAGLRQTLSKILSPLKEAGRKPHIISDPSISISESDLNVISAEDLLEAADTVQALETSPLAVVPIILTSAVKGTGVNKLHALLRQLPLPPLNAQTSDSARALFHIEDVYSVASLKTSSSSERSAVIGGHLRYGSLNIGDELFLGPYPVDTGSDDSDSGSGRPSTRNSPVPTSRSFPGALHKSQPRNPVLRSSSGALVNDKNLEWRRVRITSLRNLRLPVRALQAGQVGTIGIEPLDAPIRSPAINRIRKGMVLADSEPEANRVISVRFAGLDALAIKGLSVGSAVVVYFASVRASSKVISIATEAGGDEVKNGNTSVDDEEEFGFGFDEDLEENMSNDATVNTTVATFQFIASREFVEIGTKVLILPGGGPGLTGGTERGEKGIARLEGFVGRVIEGHR